MEDKSEIAGLTADVVAAYVGNNPVPATQIAELIVSVHGALTAAASGGVEEPKAATKPAVPVRRSVQDDAISCLECGKSFKSLKRHLRSHHDTTPDEYRVRWRLAPDYPMVAPNYAAVRSKMAKAMKLGRKKKR